MFCTPQGGVNVRWNPRTIVELHINKPSISWVSPSGGYSNLHFKHFLKRCYWVKYLTALSVQLLMKDFHINGLVRAIKLLILVFAENAPTVRGISYQRKCLVPVTKRHETKYLLNREQTQTIFPIRVTLLG